MLDNILNHNLFLYIISATGVLGIAIRLVVNGYMKGLVRGAKNMEATRKRPLSSVTCVYWMYILQTQDPG